MQEIEHRDRNGRPQLSQSNFRVPSSRSAYGSTPGWVEKATKDFLDDAGDTEPGIGIKKLPYTRPQLRETIKRRIMAGSDGGRPGQWSARKAQLVAQAYRRAGGGYRGKPGRAQRSLKKWTSERWTTSDGKPARRKGRMTRYLPAAAWKRLTPAQRRATIAKKLSGDRAGRQFVANTQRAASASKKIRSKTLGPSVEEVSKNPNAPRMFANSSSEEDRIVSTEPLEQPFSPNKEKLNEIGNAPSYGSNPPVKPFIPGNLDIDNREPIEKQNGSLALIEPTIIDGSGDEAGMFIIVPLITKFGQIIEPSNASSHFSKTSDHLGKFKSREDAEQYLEWLKDIEEEISYRDKKKPIISMHPIEKIVELAGDGFESRRQSIKNTIKRIADKYMTEKALGPTLRAANSVQIYDPDAIDADNDGLVQDATPWMRPALPSSPIIAGLRSAKNSNVVSQRAMKEAREFADFISQHEPELTEMMKGFANKKGSSLYLRGLKNRKKTAESLALKAQRLQHLFDGDLTDSITSMNDPLRYTFESDDVNNYTKDVLDVISALAKKGHKASVTNYWTSGDPYKGVNVMVDHPDGFFYEIQFHTPSSYRLKNKLTPLYEKYRDEKNVKKRQEIYDEMLKLSKGVSIPKDIGKFGEPLSRGSGKADFKPARPGKLIPTPLGLSSRTARRGLSSQQNQRSDVPLRMPVPDDWFIGDTERSQVERNFPDFHLRWDERQGLYVPATGRLKENAGGYDRLADTELAGAYLTRKYWHPAIASSDSRVASIMNKWRSDFSDSRAITRALAGLDVPNSFDSPGFRKDVQVLGEALSDSTPLGIPTYRVARLTPDVGRSAEIGDELSFAAAAVAFSPNDAQGFELDELSMTNASSKFMFEFPIDTRGLIFDDGGEKAAKRPFAEGGDRSPKEAIVSGKFRVARIEEREVRDPNKRQGVMRDVYVLESVDDTQTSSSGMSSRRIEADKPLPLSEISPDLSDKFPATNTRSGGITTIAKIPERRRISERLSRLLRRSYSRITNDGRGDYSTAATKDILKDVLRDDLTKLQDGTFLRMSARESLKDDRKRLLNSLRIIFDTRKGSEAVNLPTMHAEPYEPFRSMVDPEIDWSSIYLPTEQDAEDLLREIATLKIGDEPSESERASINDEWKFIRLSTHDKFERSAPDNIPLEDFKFIEDETFISIYEAGMRNASLFLGGIHDGMHLAVGRGFDRHGEYAALLAEISFILQIPELSDKMRNIVASEKLREILGVPFGEAVEEIIPDIDTTVYDMPKVFDAMIRRSTYKGVGGMSSRNSTRSIRSASEADIDAISQEYLGSERFSRRLSEVHGIESQIGMRSIRERIPMKEVLQSTQELDDENNDSKYMQNQVWKNLNEELEKRLLAMDGWDDAQKERIKKQVDNLLMNLRAMRDDWQSMGRRERSGILRRERIIDGFESHPEIDMNIDDIIKQAELRIHDDGTLSFKLPPNPILRKLVPGDRDYQDVEVPDGETIRSIFDNLKGKLDTRQWYELFESIYQRVGGIAQLAVFPANGEELPHHSLYLPSYKKRFATKFPGSSDAIQYRYNDIAARILQHYVGPELEKVKRNENPKIGQVVNDNDYYIHGYLGLMADPHAWREMPLELEKRFEVPPSVILHDVLGHYANGNTFDRHGEWGNILATIALARDKEFWEKLRQIPELADLTDEDREIFIRGLLADVAANWLQRVGYPVGGSFRLEDIKEKINFYDGPIDELLDKLDPPSTRSQGGMSSTRRIPLTNMTDGQLVNLGLQSVDGVAIRGKMFKPSGMSSRRREMTDSEKSRFRPITLAPDEKVKLQPGTTLVYTNEDDQIIRTELIGPQVARVRGIPGLKLYTDPNPDNQDEVDARMRQWEIDFGPISSDQRQARGRGSQPDRTAREQGRPRTTNEDPIDRILRETEEARSRRGLSSRTNPATSKKYFHGSPVKLDIGEVIRPPSETGETPRSHPDIDPLEFNNANYVYLTSNLDEAAGYASDSGSSTYYVYEVEPLSPEEIETDPEVEMGLTNDMDSVRVQRGVKIVGRKEIRQEGSASGSRGLSSRTDTSAPVAVLEKLSDEEIRALATRKGLTKRELDVIYKNIVDARDFIRRSKNEPLSHAPGLSEETAKRMRDSIRVEMAPNGVPMVIAEPFGVVIDEVPDKRDWSKVLAPSLKDMQRLVDAIREARDSDSPILEELSQESKDRVNNAAYNTDPESPFGTIIARILKQLGSTEYRGTSTGAYDSWVGIYLEGLANPKRMQAGQGSDGVHDFFGHFGVGRGFDRHGEWAAALVTDSLIRDHPAFDFLTPDEREQLRREFFVSGAGGALRINQQLNTEYEERFGISRDFATQRYDIPSRTLVDVVDTRTPEERDTAKAFMNIDNIIYGELAPVGTTIQDKYLTMDEILDLLGVPPSTTRSEARSGSQGMASTRSSRNSIPFTKASDELLLSIAGNEAAIKKERSIRNISGMSSRTDAYFIPQKDRLRLTDAQKQRIAELNAEGLTDMQIARELGISKESVIRVRKKGNIPAANRPSKNEERNKKIISMVKQGMTHTQIAKELGIHKQSVMEAVLRHARDTGENYSSFDARDIPRRKKIIELNKLGKTDVEIAREVGLSPHSVGRIRKQEGLTVNFSGRKRLNSPD